jgi:hypothetical protein
LGFAVGVSFSSAVAAAVAGVGVGGSTWGVVRSTVEPVLGCTLFAFGVVLIVSSEEESNVNTNTAVYKSVVTDCPHCPAADPFLALGIDSFHNHHHLKMDEN